MIFWLTTLLMIFGSVLLVLIPMSRHRSTAHDNSEGVSFYETQLHSVDDRLASGNGVEEDLLEERAEIARRLIKEVERETEINDTQHRSKAPVFFGSLFALIGVPAITLLIYLSVGEPGKPDIPYLAQRAQEPPEQRSELLVARVEKILKNNPDDARGWGVLANYYQSAGQPKQAIRALRNIERINGKSGSLSSRIGALLTMSNNGVVTDEAKDLFSHALARNENDSVASSHMAIAYEQEGKTAEALKLWKELRERSPQDSQAYQYSSAQVVRLGGGSEHDKQRPVDRETQAAIASLPPEERNAMIQNMVAGLAERLQEETGTIGEWVRLVRSYVVLNDRENAKKYLKLARSKFSSSPGETKILNDLADTLKLNGLGE